MNRYRLTSIALCTVLLASVLSSCGGEEKDTDQIIASGDLAAMTAEREALKTEELALAEKLKRIDAAIAEKDTVQNLPLITTLTIVEEPFEHFIELQGDVQTKNNLVLYPEFSGLLRQVLVTEGQRVSKGQVLARIDDGGLGQQRAQMQIQADLAKTTYERQARLWEQKIGSEIQFLQAKTSFEAQQEALAQMDAQLAKTTIRAPFTGVVDEVITEQGAVVAPGQTPIMRVVGLRDMYVEMDVPETHLPNIAAGKTAQVLLPVIGKTIESKIRSVGSYINPANRTFKVEVALSEKDPSIKPNLNARVRLNDYSSAKAVLIPQSVINEDAEGKEYVYVMKEKKGTVARAERAFVELGRTNGDRVEVLSGLQADDEIVIEGARAIREGQKVEIR